LVVKDCSLTYSGKLVTKDLALREIVKDGGSKLIQKGKFMGENVSSIEVASSADFMRIITRVSDAKPIPADVASELANFGWVHTTVPETTVALENLTQNIMKGYLR
jgi:hypothetical protein